LVAATQGAILPCGAPYRDAADFRALDNDSCPRHRIADTIAPNWHTHSSCAPVPNTSTKSGDVEVMLQLRGMPAGATAPAPTR